MLNWSYAQNIMQPAIFQSHMFLFYDGITSLFHRSPKSHFLFSILGIFLNFLALFGLKLEIYATKTPLKPPGNSDVGAFENT